MRTSNKQFNSNNSSTMKQTLSFKTAIALLSLFLSGAITLQAKVKPKAKHVIMIGIDGWASKSMARADMPTVKTMMAEGCWTLQKRSVLPSASAINWASNMMGAGTESHGYTKWNSEKPDFPSSVVNSHGIFPTIFSILKEQRPTAKTAAQFDWIGIKYVIDTLAVDDVMFSYRGGYGLDSCQDCGSPFDYTRRATDYIKAEKPTLFFLYYGGLDMQGHEKGWYTDDYYAFETVLDQCIAQVVQAVKDAGIYDNTVFVITADHGGTGKHHGGATLDEMLSPFIVCGKGIRRGFEITDAMMQYDVPATVAYILGLTPPQAWVGRPVMQIF